MKPLFTEEQFKLAKSKDLLPCQCYQCSKIFYQTKHQIQEGLNPNRKKKCKYCSKECENKSQITKQIVKCTNCGKEFEKYPNQFKKSKSGNHFCSHSCACTYQNTHKTTGYRRSKLEIYLETKLTSLYPNLLILFNNKEIINSELDIYISSLKLAFELNGLFHYEPIFGDKTFMNIQNNDNRKFQACLEHNIELCIIDTSSQKYFKEETSQKYLDIIINIINNKLK